MSKSRRGERTKEGPVQEAGETEMSMASMMRMLQEERQTRQEGQRMMLEQQRMLQTLLEKQQEERTQHRQEIEALLQKKSESEPVTAKVKLPKPTLQKLAPQDNVEHFLATFERVATQQGWPQDVWATQLAGLLTGKAMAAFASLRLEDATSYEAVKAAILLRYDISEETHRLRFRQDRKKGEESHREWADRLRDHFGKWTKARKIPLEELVTIEQFLQSVPDDLRVWLRERKPETLRQAAVLADDYVLARKGESQVTDAGGYHGNTAEQRVVKSQEPWTGGQMSSKEPRQYYRCGKLGHIAHLCPNRRGPGENGYKPALLAIRSDSNETRKHLRHGRMEGKSVQMLTDSGCEMTMVAAGEVDQSKVDHAEIVPVLCVHGHTVEYPTTTVELCVGEKKETARVAVAPRLLVPVLLGRDIWGPRPKGRYGNSEVGSSIKKSPNFDSHSPNTVRLRYS